jgi:hypothetical protein
MKSSKSFRFPVAAFLLVAVSLASRAGAQQQAPPPTASTPGATQEKAYDASVDLMRQDIRAERKKIVAANLPLTADEATKFWPLYDQYIAETVKVNDARYALIKNYAQSYDSMSGEQADSLIKRWLALDQQNNELRMKFIPEFEKVISQKKTAMFFQIDRRVGMMIELQLSDQIPLVKP